MHRDIKPSNLLLDTRGIVWVTDFGLAKTDDRQDLTHPGDLLGTLRYMPPEAFEGRVDARGDVYALGLTLYELLAFRPAFDERDRPKLIKQVTSTEPTRLRMLNPRVPRDLETIVHKAIDRDPSRRYSTAGELAADLQRFIDDRPIRARRVRALEQLGRWCRHNRAVAGLLLSVVALLAVLAAGGTITSFRLESHLTRAETAERDARKREFEALVAQAKAGRFSRRKGQRFDTLQAVREALTLLPELELPEEEQRRHRDELRNLAISALILPDLHLRRQVPRPSERYSYQAQSEGSSYLDSNARGDVLLFRAADHQEIARLPGEGQVTPVTFNPLNENLVWVYRPEGEGYRLLEWDPATGRTRVLVEQSVGRNGASVNLNLTRWAIANDNKGVLECRELPSFRLLRLLAVGKGDIRHALSPDGRQVAVVTGLYGERSTRNCACMTWKRETESPSYRIPTACPWPNGCRTAEPCLSPASIPTRSFCGTYRLGRCCACSTGRRGERRPSR